MLDKSALGTNEDGSANGQYCSYCYARGEFTADLTMEEMINTCVGLMTQAHPELSLQQARAMMKQVLPTLARWKKGSSSGGAPV